MEEEGSEGRMRVWSSMKIGEDKIPKLFRVSGFLGSSGATGGFLVYFLRLGTLVNPSASLFVSDVDAFD